LQPDPSLSPEFSLLARFVAPALAGADHSHTANDFTMGRDIDWNIVLALAERHRVTPALASAIARHRAGLPSPVQSRLDKSLAKAAFDELAQAALARDIVAAFRKRTIGLILLKGVPLSLRLHGRLGLRVSRDIDLLVAPSDVPSALDILTGMGFRSRQALEAANARALHAQMRRHKDVELVHDERQQVVELHWRLFDNSHLMPLPENMVAPEITWPSGVVCSVLPDRFNRLYLANHGAQHGWSRLKWLIDFAALMAPLRAEGIAQFYSSVSIAEGRRSVAQALLLCHQLFGWPLPEQVRADARRDWRVTMLLKLALHSMAQGGAQEIEDIRFGATRKNISHYLIRSSPRYLWSELIFDLHDVSGMPQGSRWRKWGAVGRMAGWITRAGKRHG